MERKTEFRYYYGNEAEQFSFFKIPKLLITDEMFRDLSNDAKILYGLLLDRMSLSVKNKWFDEENRAYIVCSIEEISKLLNCGRNKAIKSLQELDSENGIGLIEKRRVGQGNNTIIYVKNFLIEQERSDQQSNTGCSEVSNVNFQKFKNQTSKGLKKGLLEVCKSNPNNTNNNYTENTETESNLIVSRKDERYDSDETVRAYQELIRENMEYDILLQKYPGDKNIIDEICQLILETLTSSNEEVLIASNKYPSQLVKSKFMKLEHQHIEYVITMLKSNTTKVRNIKKYILAALFNAPSTITSYYRAEVNHDFPQYAASR